MTNEAKNKPLLKVLGLGFGIAVTLGGTIGTGILRKPGPIAENIGEPYLILLVWLLVGLYAVAGSMTAAELGVSIPKAGAWYVYAKRAFGSYFGFVTGITSWLGTVSALAFGAYSFSEFMAIIFPKVEAFIPFLSIALILLVYAFHLIGTKASGKSQEILAVIKAVGLLIFVVVCFVYGGSIETNNIPLQDSARSNSLIAGLIIAFQAVFYTFDGWHTASYFSEEQKDPAKSLPKSMIYGTVIILVIYLLVNIAILYVVPMAELKGAKLAAALAVEKIFGPSVSFWVTLFLMISILGIINAQVMFAPRVIYSMSRDGLFFKQATTVNSTGAPVVALSLTVLLSILLIIMGRVTCERLSDIAVFFFVLSYGAGFISLMRLRIKEPDLPRPYQAPFYPYLPIVLIIISGLFLIGVVLENFLSSIYALSFLIISYPLHHYLFKKQR
ncbi:MAG TPA: amino acid permease [Saprospiraceae bacterium]|nr:amino acid permease [Saprospiraceae bacterium]